MTKSASKAAARKTRNANPKTASKGRGKAGNKHHKPAAKVAAEMVRDTHRKTTALFEQFRRHASAGHIPCPCRKERGSYARAV